MQTAKQALTSTILTGVLLICISVSSCTVSLRGISIPDDTNTFFVEQIKIASPDAPPDYANDLTELLRDKIRQETDLQLVSKNNADIIFSGSVSRYRITAEAPQQGNITAFNRITIGVSIDVEDTQDKQRSWKQSFSQFSDFPSETSFNSVQDEKEEEINEVLLDQIFNRAFVNDW